MSAPSRIPWPSTYLGRLHAVTTELRALATPASPDDVASRFEGVTTEQVEGVLAALVLFGRVEKKGDDFLALEEPGEQ